MSKHKDSLQTHHLYLGAGGMLAVAALVVALTFGLSSAEHGIPDGHTTTCSTGQHWDTAMNSCVPDSCPTGYTGTPPNCTPSGGDQWATQRSECAARGTDYWWDDGAHTCNQSQMANPADACTTAGGTYNAANSPPCTMPITDQWATQRSECAARGTGYLWDTAMNICKTPTVGSCTLPAVWDAATSTCKPSTAGTEADCTRANGTWKPIDSTHASPWCDMGRADGQQGTQWTQTRTECPISKPISCEANNAYTCTVTQVECDGYRNVNQQPRCPTDQYWNGTSCVTGTPPAYGDCRVNARQSSCTAQAGCRWFTDSGGSYCEGDNYTPPGDSAAACAQAGGTYDATKSPPCTMPDSQRCPTGEHWESSRNGCVADQTFRTCGPNERPTETNPCRPSDDRPPPPPDLQPGQCAPDQQQCPDRFDASRTVCMPSELRWDPRTKTRVDPPRPATCADFEPPMEPDMLDKRGFRPRDRGPRIDFGKGRGEGEDRPMNPCEANPDDLICQFGFDFNKYRDQHSLDQSNIDVDQYQVRNAMGDIKRLQRESKKWIRDAKDARRQLQEISRESGGFACPAAAEVDALATELENATNQINALNENSTKEEIQRGLALNDHVYGRPDPVTGEQTVGITGKLYGGPPDPVTGVPIPGKIQGLNVCRELSGVIFGACQAYKGISREFENIKENAPAEAVAVFEEVLPKLKERCEDPLAVLQRKGISLDVLSEPFYPDPEVCDFGGFGPGPFPGPFPGPMPMGGGPGGPFPGGEFGPHMGGPFGDIPLEMREMVKEKMKEFESSGRFGGGFPGGGRRGSGDDSYPDPGFRGGSNFKSSVLMAPSHPVKFRVDEDDFFDDDDEDEEEEFEDHEGFGPPECKPPVMRYLGFEHLMRQLDQVRPLMAAHFGSMNACKMFEMGKKMSDRESVRGGRFGGPPPEVQDLMALGLQACEAGDTELVERIKAKMMRFGRHSKGGLKGIVDVDALMKDKFKAKFQDLLGDEEDSDDETVRRLKRDLADAQSQLEELTKVLSEAQQTILVLKEQVVSLSTKMAQAGVADKDALAALTNFGSLSDDDKTSTTLARLEEVVELSGDVKDVLKEALPATEEKKVLAACDAAVKSLVAAPPTDNIVTDIKDSLVALRSYATSGADKKEITDKAIEECSNIAAANVMDVSAKVAGGTCASGDTCNFREWYAAPALEAKELGFIAKELREIKPGEPETRCAAVTRVARLMEKTGGPEIDLDDKSPERSVEGAPDWCLPFINALQEKGVPFAEGLKDPNTPIERGEVAVLIRQSLGDKLPDPPNAEEFLTPDTKNLSEEVKAAIAQVRFNGIFDTVDGEHFAPKQIFNRAQNSLVTIKAREAVLAASEK